MQRFSEPWNAFLRRLDCNGPAFLLFCFRMRLLQLLVALLLPIGVACRGVTVLFRPFDLGFEILRFANVRSRGIVGIRDKAFSWGILNGPEVRDDQCPLPYICMQVVCVVGMVLTISIILVLKPTHDAYLTDKALRQAFGGHWMSNPIANTAVPSDPVSSRQRSGDAETAAANEGPVDSDQDLGRARQSANDPHTPLVVRVS